MPCASPARRPADTGPTDRGATILRVVLTILAVWTALALLAGVFVAAVGRSGLREDELLGHLPALARQPAAEPERRVPAAASGERPV